MPRLPKASSIVSYGIHCGEDANVSFRLLEKKIIDLVTIYSGCGAVRLAYTAGGRVVAGSNPVIPT